jgi:hypothetical protein
MATNDGPTRAWNGLIAVAGAVAGLTVLVYMVGAVTIWARLRAAGLPADIAGQHYSRAEVIALGFRGILSVAAVVVGLIGLLYLLLLGASYLLSSRSGSDDAPESGRATSAAAEVRTKTLVDAADHAVLKLSLGKFRLLGIVGAAAIAGSAFVSWHLFAGVLLGVAVIGATLRHLHQRTKPHERPSLALIVITLLAAACAGVSWQLQPPVKIQAVRVIPDPGAKGVALNFLKSAKGTALPYFGETSTHVYVGEIAPQQVTESNQFPWKYTRRILEIRREGVRLIFEDDKGILYAKVKTPAVALFHGL